MKLILLSVTFLFAVSTLFNPIRSYAADRITVALTTVGGSFLAGGVAAKRGFFQQEGLNAELVQRMPTLSYLLCLTTILTTPFCLDRQFGPRLEVSL
jgi:hypothetical protein